MMVKTEEMLKNLEDLINTPSVVGGSSTVVKS